MESTVFFSLNKFHIQSDINFLPTLINNALRLLSFHNSKDFSYVLAYRADK